MEKYLMCIWCKQDKDTCHINKVDGISEIISTLKNLLEKRVEYIKDVEAGMKILGHYYHNHEEARLWIKEN